MNEKETGTLLSGDRFAQEHRKERKMTGDAEKVIRLLDAMTEAEVGRIRLEVSGELEAGETKKAYHHGRCDVGSPFATGKLFDLEENR